MLILSPRWASVRMSAQSEIVREVPPPPLEVSSCFSRVETAAWGQLSWRSTICGLILRCAYCL